MIKVYMWLETWKIMRLNFTSHRAQQVLVSNCVEAATHLLSNKFFFARKLNKNIMSSFCLQLVTHLQCCYYEKNELYTHMVLHTQKVVTTHRHRFLVVSVVFHAANFTSMASRRGYFCICWANVYNATLAILAGVTQPQSHTTFTVMIGLL